MVTIQAPGIEINEKDLSFYDFPGPREDTTNVYVTGFASKGLNYVPHKFTSKNTAQDLIDTFGVPENEAERYFYNACNEVISKDKTVLYASRLPYCNTSISTMNGAEYVVSSMADISADYRYWFGFVNGKIDAVEQISVMTDDDAPTFVSCLPIDLFGFMNDKKSFFNVDFGMLSETLSSKIAEATALSDILPFIVDSTVEGVSYKPMNSRRTSGWVITGEPSNGCPCYDETYGIEQLSNVMYDFKLDTPIDLKPILDMITQLSADISADADLSEKYSGSIDFWNNYLELIKQPVAKKNSASGNGINCNCDCCGPNDDCGCNYTGDSTADADHGT